MPISMIPISPNPAIADVPENVAIGLRRSHELRYGENPHQAAGYYSRGDMATPLGAQQLAGKQLSYNNILDCDSAWRAVSSFAAPTAIIVKHLNPTGIASASSLVEALPQALASDPLSAFGGIIALNGQVDEALVAALGSLFVEAIIAPAFSDAARERLRSGRRNCRLLRMDEPFQGRGFEFRSVTGGMLLQRCDMGDPAGVGMTAVSKRLPREDEMRSLEFAWRAVQHVRSNAIVLAQGTRTVGIGGGLPSRVDAAELAIKKAAGESRGAGPGIRRLLPLRRQRRACRAGRRQLHCPARRIHPRQPGHRSGRPPRHGHGLHRQPTLQALNEGC